MALLILSILWAGVIALLLIRAVRQYSFYQIVEPMEDDGEAALLPAPGTPGETGNADVLVGIIQRADGDDGVPTPSPALPRSTGGGRQKPRSVGSCSPSVVVIIPARNEEQNIGRCLEGLLAQQSPHEIRSIIVIDDRSTDATGRIVREIVERNPVVKLVEGKALETGWAGKPHALCQGAQVAREILKDADEDQWLCFTDADTAAQPALLRTAVSVAQSRSLDLLSLQPEQDLIGAWERLIMPCGFFLIAFTQDVRHANDPDDPNGHANGQFMLIRRSKYEAVGGYEAMRGEIFEDTAMARRIKAANGRVGVMGTKNLIRARMYHDLASLWQGLSRQAGGLLGSPVACMVAALSAIALACVSVFLPIATVAALVKDGLHGLTLASAACGFAGSLALLGTHIGAARYFKIPFWYGFLFPIGYLLGAGIAVDAALNRARGKVAWKGRVIEAQPSAKAQATGATNAGNLSRHDVGAL